MSSNTIYINKIWTDYEIEIIKTMWSESKTSTILHYFNEKTTREIGGMAYKLGIKKFQSNRKPRVITYTVNYDNSVHHYCTKCKLVKLRTEFNKSTKSKNGLQNKCKYCQKEYLEKNKEQAKVNYRIRYKNNRENILKNSRKSKQKNKEKNREYNKSYAEKNKDSISEYQRIYHQKNKEEITLKRKIRRNTNTLVQLSHNMRAMISASFNKKGFKKSKKTERILGCTIENFKIYIESKFLEGMSWENRSLWHVDHYYPQSMANTAEELEELNHHTNLRPIWAIDNLQKNNKIPTEPMS